MAISAAGEEEAAQYSKEVKRFYGQIAIGPMFCLRDDSIITDLKNYSGYRYMKIFHYCDYGVAIFAHSRNVLNRIRE
jgi:hypothetical protein